MKGNIAETRDKFRAEKWKKKAIVRGQENKALRKRLREVIASRDSLKAKSKMLSRRSVECSIPEYEHVKHHSYDSGIMWLCIWLKLVGNCSFRSCQKVILGMSLYLGLGLSRSPSCSTIRLWLCKYGYHCYEEQKSGGKWAIIADESVMIGQERLLLILGVNLDKWDFKRSLTSADVEVLHVGIGKSWKSKEISIELKKVISKYNISYSVSDLGNNLQGAWKAEKLVNVLDCTHTWAKSLEKIYQKDEVYISFMKSVGAIKRKWILSKNSHLLPPSLRDKARFHQVFNFVNWAEKIEKNWDNLNEEQQKELVFIPENKDFLHQLKLIRDTTTALNKVLKIKGMNLNTIEEAMNILAQHPNTGDYIGLFQARAKEYLMTHKSLLKKDQTFLCCSDIIESTFGRYKQMIAKNQGSITELVLTLSALGKPLYHQKIKIAMEEVKVEHIKLWKQENTTLSLSKIKRDFFPKNGTKSAA